MLALGPQPDCQNFLFAFIFWKLEPFRSPEFMATQDVILTDYRFVKWACTSFFSKLLVSSEKSQIEPTHDLGDTGVTELPERTAPTTLHACS